MSFYMNAIHGVAGKMALQFILRGHEGGGRALKFCPVWGPDTFRNGFEGTILFGEF